MDKATFYVRYVGPATQGGRIDVRLFSPALEALAGACQEANRVLNSESRTEINVFIRADLRDGSFTVTLEAVVGLLDAAQGWLGEHTTASEIIDLLGLAGLTTQDAVVKSALAVWRFLRGHRPVKRQVQSDGKMEITNRDGQVIVADDRALVLAENRQVTNNYFQFTFPVRTSGIDQIEVGSAGGRSDRVTAADVPEHQTEDLAGTDEPLMESTTVDLVEIVTPAFRPKLKWRLSRGGSSFPAAMADTDFLQRVENGEMFRKGDFLKARIRSSVREENGATRLQHVVLKVLEHPGKTNVRQASLLPPDQED